MVEGGGAGDQIVRLSIVDGFPAGEMNYYVDALVEFKSTTLYSRIRVKGMPEARFFCEPGFLMLAQKSSEPHRVQLKQAVGKNAKFKYFPEVPGDFNVEAEVHNGVADIKILSGDGSIIPNGVIIVEDSGARYSIPILGI